MHLTPAMLVQTEFYRKAGSAAGFGMLAARDEHGRLWIPWNCEGWKLQEIGDRFQPPAASPEAKKA